MVFVEVADKFFFNNFKGFKLNYNLLDSRSSKRGISLVIPFFSRSNYGKLDSKFLNLVGKKKSDKYIFKRFLKVNTYLSNIRVGVYNGKKFQSFKTHPFFLGLSLNNFIHTRKLINNQPNLRKKGSSTSGTKRKNKK